MAATVHELVLGNNVAQGVGWQLFYTVAATGIIAVLIVGAAISYRYLDRRRLLRFFGVRADNPNLFIYLSRILVKPSGSRGFIGAEESSPRNGRADSTDFEPEVYNVKTGFQGPAASRTELLASQRVQRLFTELSVLRIRARRLRDLIGRLSVVLSYVNVEIDTSPPREIWSPRAGAVVLLGSGVYNGLTYGIEKRAATFFRLHRTAEGSRSWQPRPGRSDLGLSIPGRDPNKDLDRELAVLERIPGYPSLIRISGTSDAGTAGAATFLAGSWRELSRLGADKFAILLAFDNQPANNSDGSDLGETATPQILAYVNEGGTQIAPPGGQLYLRRESRFSRRVVVTSSDDVEIRKPHHPPRRIPEPSRQASDVSLEERYLIVTRLLRGRRSKRELRSEYKVSGDILENWRDRFEAGAKEALAPRLDGRPLTSATTSSVDLDARHTASEDPGNAA
jgi:hypothetical protein